MYDGAYRALESDNPDHYRHRAVSMREIVRKMLGGSKEETRRILKDYAKSEKDLKMLMSLQQLVNSIYEAFNKGVHYEIQFCESTIKPT